MAKKPSNELVSKSEQKRVEVLVPAAAAKLKSFSVAKYGVGDWRVVTYEVQDDKIVGKSSSEGSDKALCLERFKIMIAKEFFLGK